MARVIESYSDSDSENELTDIQAELEEMNVASLKINKVEKELEEARANFRGILSNSSSSLNAMLKKHRKSIERSRQYYELEHRCRETQSAAQNAAVQFRRASSFYKAAKETISLAEQRLSEDGVEFDEAWQEMLNHSTTRMLDAEKDKMRSELEHHRKSVLYQELTQKLHILSKRHKRSVAHAKPYYELKIQLETQLQSQKRVVEDLQKSVTDAKLKYKRAMSNLENISEKIHERRISLPAREPGVGSDSTSEDECSLLETDLEKHMGIRIRSDSELSSGGSSEMETDSVYSYSSSSSFSSHSSISRQSSTSLDLVDSAICSPKNYEVDFENNMVNMNMYREVREVDGASLDENDFALVSDRLSQCTILEDDAQSIIEKRSRENTMVYHSEASDDETLVA